MFDTNLVVVGNVLTTPEWRKISKTGSMMANFRIASTARRFDRESGQWIDGNNLRVRVTAWRRLAEGVAASIEVGDPVVVYGKLYCRDWTDDKNNRRVSYEMEAMAVGHDLSRGRAKFLRTKPGPLVSEIESPDADELVGGEPSVLLTGTDVPVVFGDGVPERLAGEEAPSFLDVVAGLDDVKAIDAPPAASQGGEEEEDELSVEVERLAAEQSAPRRSRRTKREPVPA